MGFTSLGSTGVGCTSSGCASTSVPGPASASLRSPPRAQVRAVVSWGFDPAARDRPATYDMTSDPEEDLRSERPDLAGVKAKQRACNDQNENWGLGGLVLRDSQLRSVAPKEFLQRFPGRVHFLGTSNDPSRRASIPSPCSRSTVLRG